MKYENPQIDENCRFGAGDRFCGRLLCLASVEMKLILIKNVYHYTME